MWKRILLSIAIATIFIVLAGVLYVWHIERRLAAEDRNDLEKLAPQVILGQGKFQKHSAFDVKGVGSISDIVVGYPAAHQASDIVVVGTRGATFLSVDGKSHNTVTFGAGGLASKEFVAVDKSANYGFITRNQSWASPVIWFDKDGTALWTYKKGAADDSAVGTLEANGKPRVVVGLNGGGGLTLLDEHGEEIWNIPESNVWHVEFWDPEGKGASEILHTNAQGQLRRRSSNGRLIAQFLEGFYVSDFHLTRWADETRPTHILAPINDNCREVLLVLDHQGNALAKLEAPFGSLMRDSRGTTVRLMNHRTFYAVVRNAGHLDRSMVLIYDEATRPVYQEILAATCLGTAALPRGNGESLLVGCTDQVLEYVPSETREKNAN